MVLFTLRKLSERSEPRFCPILIFFLFKEKIRKVRLFGTFFNPFFRKISLAKPKKYFWNRICLLALPPLKSTKWAYFRSSPLFENSKFEVKEQSSRDDDKKTGQRIILYSNVQNLPSFLLLKFPYNCWYFQSIMLFKLRKIVRFPLVWTTW